MGTISASNQMEDVILQAVTADNRVLVAARLRLVTGDRRVVALCHQLADALDPPHRSGRAEPLPACGRMKMPTKGLGG